MNAFHRLMGAFTASVLVVTLFGGCATLKEEGGYVVQSKSDSARQEPWHNVALIGDIRTVDTIAVAPYNLPEPLPLKWEQEFVDEGRSYAVTGIDGRQARKPLVRVVERALLYNADGKLLELFDAVFFPDQRRFLVLMSPEKAQASTGHHMVIVSSDGTWLMTGRKKMVDLPIGQDLRQLPPGFFRDNPSELRQVFVLKRPDPILMDLTWRFGEHFSVRDVTYSGTRDAYTVLGQFTSLSTALDKVVSCGSFTISPGMAPISMAVSLARDVYVVTQQDCLARKKN